MTDISYVFRALTDVSYGKPVTKRHSNMTLDVFCCHTLSPREKNLSVSLKS